MDLRKWFSTALRSVHVAALAELGYEIETKYQADGKGGRKYYSWDIKGIPQSVITKTSRRSAEVEQAEQEAVTGDQGARPGRRRTPCRPWPATSWAPLRGSTSGTT